MHLQTPHTCLGIPTPKSVTELVSAPSICLPSCGDQVSLEIIQELGQCFHRQRDEIAQACNLAAGFSDIVIILERPRDRKDHTFDVSFDKFVQDCETLKAIDELIRFATRGARSIYTVTVLNAFFFQPDKYNTQQDEECHEALARIFKAKRPKVVLRCHREEYMNEWLKRIELPGNEYRLQRKEVKIDEEHTTIILQSFHPSCAVNNTVCRPEFRALLIYHFIAAFSELRSEFSLPESAEKIRELCLIKGQRRESDIPCLKTWQAAFFICRTLNRPYQGPDKAPFPGFVEETPLELRRRQIGVFDSMYGLLERLFGNSQTFGALGIAKLVLFLWKGHFQGDPLYQNVMTWLLLRGNEQESWFPGTDHSSYNHRPLEEQFSGLRVEGPSIVHDIQESNEKARCLSARASAAIVGAENLEPDLRTELIDVFRKHKSLVNEYVRSFPMSEINQAMRIRNLVVSCETFVTTISNEDCSLEQKDFWDLTCCLEILANLIDLSARGLR